MLAPRLDGVTTRVCADVPWLEAALGRLEPTLSLHAVRARVTSVVDETPDTRTFWLRPNARCGSFRAGSYVTVHVTISGERVQRNYSISCVESPSSPATFCASAAAQEVLNSSALVSDAHFE